MLAVLAAVRKKVKKDQPTEDLDYLETMLYRAIDLERAGGVTIDLMKLGSKAAQGAVQIGLSFIPGAAVLGKVIEELQKLGTENISQGALDAIQRERTKIHIEQVRFLEQFQDKFQTLIQNHVQPGRLVVFVDDLDRCLPDKAIQVLEAIKLFLDVPQCVFILGLDHDVIACGVEIRYKDFIQSKENQKDHPIDGEKYLEKIIQLPFTIPPIESSGMEPFVRGLTPDWGNDECPRVFAEGLGDNPRQVKRNVNVYLMLARLAEERKLQAHIHLIRLAKVVVIQAVAPDLYLLLKDQPGLLRDIEQYYRVETSPKVDSLTEEGATSRQRAPADQSQVRLAEDLLRLVLQTPAVRRILTMHPPELAQANFHDLGPSQLQVYFTLARSAEAPLPAPVEASRQVFEPQMVRVPAGVFLMGSTKEQAAQAIKDGAEKGWVEEEQPQHKVELAEYLIGKYPVTCREYQVFVKEANYLSPGGWSGEQFPDGKGGHPVVNVSWEDAAAYCNWLKERSGKAYRLPSEAEWEKAARGDDGRIYPWGNEFDKEKANTDEAGVGDTTPVGQFSPQGDSPYGCADMAGNVWEWCADWYDENEYKKRKEMVKIPIGPEKGTQRLLRGGSFSPVRRGARCAYRYRNYPHIRYRNLGFRVALSPISPSDL
jgi:iron(II)-dependent oxidoreductase